MGTINNLTIAQYVLAVFWVLSEAMCAALAQEGEAPEQVVTVSNVATEQHGAFLRVTYDLETSDNQPAYVFSSFLGGAGETSMRHMQTVSGDVHADVVPGLGRWFVWNFLKDGLSGLIEGVQVRVQGGLHPGKERKIGDILFSWIPPGSFLMGRYPGEQDSDEHADPQHEVTFAQGFWMSKCEITQAQWQSIMGSNPASGSGVGENYPVYNVSWSDICEANGYLERLNTAYPGHNFRLPSEAEWEYAYRAGTTTRFYWGDDPQLTLMADYAWDLFSDRKPVGQKLPNAWWLYDMTGNVLECCEDGWHDNYADAPVDGSAWLNPYEYPVFRGLSASGRTGTGGFLSSIGITPPEGGLGFNGCEYIGFRLVCKPD